MSALAMILTAAMVVPGDAPENVSGEMEERLDVNGKWEGTYRRKGNPDSGCVWLKNGELSLYIAWFDKTIDYSPFSVEDVGNRRLRIQLGKERWLGIYRHVGDKVIISMRPSKKGYPVSFGSFRDGEYLLTLHRVESCK